VPILIITAKKEELDRVLGLELGADDYITKPFSLREVLARMKAVLRRYAEKEAPRSFVRLGGLEVDLDRYEVRVQGSPVLLGPREFEFLRHLVLAKGRVLTRESLLERVWGPDGADQINSRTIDQHVARLRGKLGPESERIVTVKNVGYRIKTD
jgi:DNA-binding response OmpR family regulator